MSSARPIDNRPQVDNLPHYARQTVFEGDADRLVYLDLLRQHCRLGRLRLFQARLTNDVCSSERNASITGAWLLRRASTVLVEQLPSRSHMIFGGYPRRKLLCRKSASLVTIANPCRTA